MIIGVDLCHQFLCRLTLFVMKRSHKLFGQMKTEHRFHLCVFYTIRRVIMFNDV